MSFGVVVGTFYAEVRLGIVGFPLLEHDLDLGKAFLVAQVGKQGAGVLAADAFRQDFGLGPQADDDAVFLNNFDVVGLGQGATSQGNHLGCFVVADFGNDFLFFLAEEGFSFLSENIGDGFADPFHNQAVGVNEGAFQTFCQGPSGTALAAGHETCKEYMLFH